MPEKNEKPDIEAPIEKYIGQFRNLKLTAAIFRVSTEDLDWVKKLCDTISLNDNLDSYGFRSKNVMDRRQVAATVANDILKELMEKNSVRK